MPDRSNIPRLLDIIDASEFIRNEMADVTLDAFELDRRKRWSVERGIEIISEASRHLTRGLKARPPRSRGERWRASATSSGMNTRMSRRRCCGRSRGKTSPRWTRFAVKNSWRRKPANKIARTRRPLPGSACRRCHLMEGGHEQD
jgi:hypothetical protein